jgi:hypothetical protein
LENRKSKKNLESGPNSNLYLILKQGPLLPTIFVRPDRWDPPVRGLSLSLASLPQRLCFSAYTPPQLGQAPAASLSRTHAAAPRQPWIHRRTPMLHPLALDLLSAAARGGRRARWSSAHAPFLNHQGSVSLSLFSGSLRLLSKSS